MRIRTYKLSLTIFLSAILAVGCASKSSYTETKDIDKKTAKIVAVLPVNNNTQDMKAGQLLRKRIFDELYFRGYSKLPLEVIDKKLESLYSTDKKNEAGVVAPNVIRELLNADAVMYCTLVEGKRKVSMFYAPVTVAASCELRSTQTGEVLWNAQYKSTSRNFDFTAERLEMKSYEAFENVLEEVVNKVLETLPEGPNLQG